MKTTISSDEIILLRSILESYLTVCIEEDADRDVVNAMKILSNKLKTIYTEGVKMAAQ